MPQHTIDTLCVFGSYDDSELYSRNRTLVAAMAACSDRVVLVRPHRTRPRASNHQRLSTVADLLVTLAEVVGKCLSLVRQRRKLRGADCYFVPYPAYLDSILLRLLVPRRRQARLVVDAFLCLHDTLVSDRNMVRAGGLLARLVSRLERSTLASADLVFIDTEQQKKLLLRQYALDERKLAVIPVGIDESRWQPLPQPPRADRFRVLFWGTFIPLHGVETIILAAHRLQRTNPEICFELIGDGQTAGEAAGLIRELGVSNITWHRQLLPAAALRDHLETAHCVLGVFGDSEKAGNVIPYKVYQALASNRIVISRQGPAISSLVGKNPVPGLLLVPAADPAALAGAIRELCGSYDEIAPGVQTRALYERSLDNATLYGRVAEGIARL